MEEIDYKKLQINFPFLTVGKYLDQIYLGIIQNCDQQILSMYIYSEIWDANEKKVFLQLGDEWWWESNRTIPINIFLKDRFKNFRRYLRTFSRKDFEVVQGPVVSLQELAAKRIKRRQIQLIKRTDK